jgi:hypothetical protein
MWKNKVDMARPLLTEVVFIVYAAKFAQICPKLPKIAKIC